VARSDGSAAPELDSVRELREKKRVLAALVVHDLRSPLSAIQGYLDLLREEVAIISGHADAQSTNAMSYIDDATTLVGKALGLVATILDVDELEDGILHAQRTPVKLVELIDRARAGNRAHLEVRQLKFDLVCDPELVIDLDRDLFARVFENLLDNGARYAPRNGVLSVMVEADERGVEIAIGNSGPAVPAAERETIFGRYFQIEARRAAARANRGLGLYFCKLAVEAHDGTIHVESRPGLGTVFVIRLPRP
jgi:two-component system, OmpR family, heavy metal sensor histidine kinase CusS